ncbi:MAG: lysoplasmalogenase [Desulfobacterales bacterium]|nr:lysoplasmalogenase [Desulfobacterales bacterium]
MNRTTKIVLTLLAAASALLTIRAEYLGPQYCLYLFKPLSMVFIIIMAVLLSRGKHTFYSYAIIAGLVFSMAGDIFLMLPSDRFISGLISFLVAHILYILAFVHKKRIRVSWPALPFIVYGILVFSVLLPHLGQLKIPVLVYVIVIMTMGWQASDRYAQRKHRFALLALIGALLFIFSDSVLALNKFRENFELARALTLGTYFPAQWFIARSVEQTLE